MAALLTRISTPPSPRATSSAMASTERRSETSASTAMAPAPAALTTFATLTAFSRETSTAAMAAPSEASLAQIPSARPPPPPVTIATRPSRGPATRTNLLDRTTNLHPPTMIYASQDRNNKAGTPAGSGGFRDSCLALDSGSKQPPHEDGGQDGRGRGRRPLEKRLYGVVFDPALIGYVYEPVGDVLGAGVGYRVCQYGYDPLRRRVVHTLPSAFYSLHCSVPTIGSGKTPRVLVFESGPAALTRSRLSGVSGRGLWSPEKVRYRTPVRGSARTSCTGEAPWPAGRGGRSIASRGGSYLRGSDPSPVPCNKRRCSPGVARPPCNGWPAGPEYPCRRWPAAHARPWSNPRTGPLSGSRPDTVRWPSRTRWPPPAS